MNDFMTHINDQVATEWGSRFLDRLGPRLAQAMLAERLLITLATMDPSVSDHSIRELLHGGWGWIVDRTDYVIEKKAN